MAPTKHKLNTSKQTFCSNGQSIRCRNVPHRKGDTIGMCSHFWHIWNEQKHSLLMNKHFFSLKKISSRFYSIISTRHSYSYGPTTGETAWMTREHWSSIFYLKCMTPGMFWMSDAWILDYLHGLSGGWEQSRNTKSICFICILHHDQRLCTKFMLYIKCLRHLHFALGRSHEGRCGSYHLECDIILPLKTTWILKCFGFLIGEVPHILHMKVKGKLTSCT